ncbi:MAG: RnfABCDGE type electron transport complex subunit G [Dehalococcoidia bacterium]|nr:MAG: RnfABCDGE type electron transport complex subunit G [Dehalococcoidia bacterium]
MKDKLGQYYPILALTVVVFISIAVLSGMDSFTRDTIQYQKELKIQRMLNQLFREMSAYDFDESTEIYTITADDTKIGYAFLGVGVGYGGNIDIVVGLENKTTLRGIAVIAHAETPGLGDKILLPDFTDKFVGLDISEVNLTRDGGKVDAITGATISSRAVVDGVRNAAMEKAEFLPD